VVAEGGRKEVAVAKKELGWPWRAGRLCNRCRTSSGFVAARPNRGSGGLLEGSRRGAEPACGSGRMRRRAEGPGAGERPGRSGRRSRARCEEEGEEDDGRAQSVREKREGRPAVGLGRGKRSAQERERGKREGWRTQAFGPGKGEVARPCAGD
jgi:hypothetical protein